MRIATFWKNTLLVWDDEGKVSPFFSLECEKRFGYCFAKIENAQDLAREHDFEFIPTHRWVHHVVEATGLGKLGINPPEDEWERILTGGEMK